MKRRRIWAAIAAGAFLLIGVAVIMHIGSAPAGGGPQYVPAQLQPKGPFRAMHYEWMDPVSTHGNRVWFYVPRSGTNQRTRTFRYDLKAHQVLGELINGGPV